MHHGFDKWYLLLILPILRMNLTWLNYRMPSMIVVPFFLLWFLHMLSLPSIWLPCRQRLKSAFILSVLFFIASNFLPLLYGGYSRGEIVSGALSWPILSQTILNVIGFIIVYYSVIKNRLIEFATLNIVVLVTIIWNGVTAVLWGDVIEGGSARFLVTAGTQLESGVASAYENVTTVAKYGFASYTHLYAYALLLPCLIYAIFKLKKSKWIMSLLGFSALSAICAIKSGGLGTPIAVLMFGLLLLICATVFRLKKGLIFLGFISSCLLSTFATNATAFSFLEKPLMALSELTEENVYKERLQSLAAAVAGDAHTYAVERYHLQKMSWEAFKNHIVIGGGTKAKIGGHSAILDMLGLYGLVGLSLFLLCIFSVIKFLNAIALIFYNKEGSFFPYLYVGVFLFAGVANPVRIFEHQIIMLISCIPLFFRGSRLNSQPDVTCASDRVIIY